MVRGSIRRPLRIAALVFLLCATGCVRRDGRIIWEKEFLSGESNMCHTLANLEYHHFKYSQFLHAGDAHVHFFGTATMSFGAGVQIPSTPRSGRRGGANIVHATG